MGWDAYWNGRTTIYVNDLHKQIHYRGVAADIISLLPHESARVLDFGCGEALSADVVAKQARTLVLCDKAQVVREGLITRFESVENISVSAPEVIAVMPSASFDLIIVNSVIQYLSRPELDALFAEWHRLLSPGGLLVVGDIVTPAGNMISDIRALLSFAACNKFFLSACAGLMRTFFSEYRSKRAQLGLLRFGTGTFLDLVRAAGFHAARRSRNLGYNPVRMTVVASKSTRPFLAIGAIAEDASARCNVKCDQLAQQRSSQGSPLHAATINRANDNARREAT